VSEQNRKERYEERMRLTRITAAKSLFKDELKKSNPSSASIAAFRKAAYGDESHGESLPERVGGSSGGAEHVVETLMEVGETTTMIAKEPDEELIRGDRGAAVTADEGTDMGDVTSEDDEMSLGESEDGGEISDEDSVSGHSTSGGESAVTRGNLKKRADESPEREATGSVRKGFPGVVSRSEAGCRIHIPSEAGVTTVNKEPTGTMAEAHTATLPTET